MSKPIEPIYRMFGARVELVRTTLGWNQDELAQRVGLTRGSIANIEGGNQRVLLGDVVTFATAFQMTPKQLLRGIWT